MSDKPEIHTSDTVERCFKIAQRAIDDLRRYVFDNTPERRVKCAQRLQADLDAFAAAVGHSHTHAWPRDLWTAGGADLKLKTLEDEASAALGMLDAAYDSHTDRLMQAAVYRSRQVIGALIEDARAVRGTIRQLETDLLLEEQESHHWARKAVQDGDLGRNPPVFLVDVVARQAEEIEALKAREK